MGGRVDGEGRKGGDDHVVVCDWFILWRGYWFVSNQSSASVGGWPMTGVEVRDGVAVGAASLCCDVSTWFKQNINISII